MADVKQEYDFSAKWRDRCREQNINYIELVAREYLLDCETSFMVWNQDGGFSCAGKESQGENARSAKIRELLQRADIGSMNSIQTRIV